MSAEGPTPAEVIELRAKVQAHYGISPGEAQARCAEVVKSSVRAWQQWEKGDRQMPASTWCLAQLRLNAHPEWVLYGRRPPGSADDASMELADAVGAPERLDLPACVNCGSRRVSQDRRGAPELLACHECRVTFSFPMDGQSPNP